MSSKKVLIVDDAKIMRSRIKTIATQAGWESCEAENGETAVEKFKSFQPDLVTLDIVMPEKDGVTALHEIRELDPDARVVMVTAVDQKEMLQECIRSGALDFIVKPFEADELLSFFNKYEN